MQSCLGLSSLSLSLSLSLSHSLSTTLHCTALLVRLSAGQASGRNYSGTPPGSRPNFISLCLCGFIRLSWITGNIALMIACLQSKTTNVFLVLLLLDGCGHSSYKYIKSLSKLYWQGRTWNIPPRIRIRIRMDQTNRESNALWAELFRLTPAFCRDELRPSLTVRGHTDSQTSEMVVCILRL